VTVYFVGHGIFYFSRCYCKKFCADVLATTSTFSHAHRLRNEASRACDFAVITLFAVNCQVCMCVGVGKCRVLPINSFLLPREGADKKRKYKEKLRGIPNKKYKFKIFFLFN
jgi:hypothetical protein